MAVHQQKQKLSPEEYESERAALLNQQQLEVAELEKRQNREQMELEQSALSDWEVSHSRNEGTA